MDNLLFILCFEITILKAVFGILRYKFGQKIKTLISLLLKMLNEVCEQMKLSTPIFKKYELDKIASSLGHDVMRLLLYYL